MDNFDVTVEKRLPQTKSMKRQLKKEGFVPGILYSNAESTPISVKLDEIKSFLQHKGENQPIILSYDGKSIPAKIMEVQREPVTLDIQHVDLMPMQPGVLH